MLTLFAVVGVLVSGVVIGLVARGWLLMPADRRRLEAMAADLLAEARIDAWTHSTLGAMRTAARDNRSQGIDDIRRYGR